MELMRLLSVAQGISVDDKCNSLMTDASTKFEQCCEMVALRSRMPGISHRMCVAADLYA